ncbi:hypothetical protein [Pseudomonas mediterranea]|uniref:hypothetical protein n=1 Tax=Pseudomonas mediterranea TaxID=183795 RepID=UPI000B160AE6|nr:hypothetical protein [Pseudomonas mediterranea]MDU9027617.1 hypothetical protein [Pseudomonas mediterranea]
MIKTRSKDSVFTRAKRQQTDRGNFQIPIGPQRLIRVPIKPLSMVLIGLHQTGVIS